MPAERLHLVRHGEVHNPQRVLYGRLPGFGLSDAGHRMANQAAEYIGTVGRPVTSLVASPLQRTRESAEPFTRMFGIEPALDDRVIEPTNVFEGKQMRRAVRNPVNWRYLAAPSLPSWGEPYSQIIARMNDAMGDAWDRAGSGDVVIVSHQLPIWMVHLTTAGLRSRHDPRRRRCGLSSITSFERDGDRWIEVGYVEPAAAENSMDVGAV